MNICAAFFFLIELLLSRSCKGLSSVQHTGSVRRMWVKHYKFTASDPDLTYNEVKVLVGERVFLRFHNNWSHSVRKPPRKSFRRWIACCCSYCQVFRTWRYLAFDIKVRHFTSVLYKIFYSHIREPKAKLQLTKCKTRTGWGAQAAVLQFDQYVVNHMSWFMLIGRR